MKAISVRIRHNPATRAKGQRSHDIRAGNQPAYVDAERTHLNSVILETTPTAQLRYLCEARRAEHRPELRKMPRTAAVATAGIITFGKEAQPVIDSLSQEEQDRLFLETAEVLADKLGTSLEGLVVHRDEAAIHAHFTLAAVGHDGRPLSKKGGPGLMSELQDLAAKPWEHLGIERGKRKALRQAEGEPISKWVHRSVQQLHADLPREIAQVQAKAEKYERLAAAAREKLENTEKAEAKAAKRLSVYERRFAEAQDEISALGDIFQKVGVDLEGWRERLAKDDPKPTHKKRS